MAADPQKARIAEAAKKLKETNVNTKRQLDEFARQIDEMRKRTERLAADASGAAAKGNELQLENKIKTLRAQINTETNQANQRLTTVQKEIQDKEAQIKKLSEIIIKQADNLEAKSKSAEDFLRYRTTELKTVLDESGSVINGLRDEVKRGIKMKVLA